MRLILVRHGQTACNVDDIWHGWDGCELTGEGLRQARAAGERLAGEPIEAVYSSDIRRAWQTAEAIAAPHGLTLIPEPRLRERNAGRFDGLSVADVTMQNPTVWEERARDYWNWRPPGGESLRDVLGRAMDAIDRIRREHPDGTAAAVTHMATKRALISALANIPMERTFDLDFPSTGVSIFQFDAAGTSTVEVLNDAAHMM